jgi:signal transduction histidine kinase
MSFEYLPRVMRTASFGLALLYSGLLALSTVVLGAIVYWSMQASLDRQMTSRINAEVDLLTQELRSEGQGELIKEISERTQFFHAFEYAATDSKGNHLVGNLPNVIQHAGWSTVTIPYTSPSGSGGTFRVRTVPLDHGIWLSVGDDLGPQEEIENAFFEAAIWAVVAFLLLGLIGGLLLSRAFLLRVDAITETAEAIIAGEMQTRIRLRGTDDNFDRLSLTLNRMLDRIQVLMESLTQVSSDIAHALRTPLSRLQHKLEAAKDRLHSEPKLEEAIDGAVKETENILTTFSALLRIAQMEAATRTAGFDMVDLSKIFETVAQAYSVAAEDQGKMMDVRIAPSVSVWGDKDLIAEMLANLLDNAITHTPAGSRISVALELRETGIVGCVADNGAGVAPDERDRIFRRFYRSKRSAATPGSGLGLALVAAVADLHGITLVADDNAPGFLVTMTFPLRSKFQAREFGTILRAAE